MLILTGKHKRKEGVCLGKADRPGLWAISPDESAEILSLAFEKDFGLLINLSANPQRNGCRPCAVGLRARDGFASFANLLVSGRLI